MGSGKKNHEVQERCIECEETSEELRKVKSKNLFTGKINEVGPYDRACAYKFKNSKIPPFNTVPRDNTELIYRVLINDEIPLNKRETKSALSKLCLMVILIIPLLYFYVKLYQWGIQNDIIATLILLFLVFLPNILILIVAIEKYENENILELTIFGTHILIYRLIPDRITHAIENYFSIEKPYFYNISWSKLFVTGISINILGVILAPNIMLLVIGSFMLFIMITYVIALLIISVFGILSLPLILWNIPQYIRRSKQSGEWTPYFVKRAIQFFRNAIRPDTYIGRTNSENFNLFWNGIIVKEDYPSLYYKILLPFYAILYITIGSIIVFNKQFVSLLKSNEYTILFIEDSLAIFERSPTVYKIVTAIGITNELWGILAIIVAILLLYVGLFLSGLKKIAKYFLIHFEPPEDIYHLAMRTYANRTKEDYNARNLIESDVSPFYMSNCPICKIEVQTGIKCRNCYSYYHKDHLDQYLTTSSLQLCPVCKIPAENAF